MTKEIDDLSKAIALGTMASDLLQKSHVKEHTRTSASGAVSQVSAYDDKRQKAADASKTAETNQAKHNWNDPRDTRVVAADHAEAAFAHIDALKHAATNEDINHHLHAASRHLQSNHSMHDFADDQSQPKVPLKNQSSRPADPTGARATRVSNYAKEISQAANGATDAEETSEGLNKKSSLHMLAMEQHHRAEESHMKVANQHFTSDPKKREDAMQLAQWHRDQSEKHGKEVRRLSGISISARSTAISASEKAYRTGKPEDHKAAADLHRAAVKLNYDSEGASEGEKQAQEHDKKAAQAKPEHTLHGGDEKTATSITHKGEKYHATGKEGHRFKDGVKVREFSTRVDTSDPKDRVEKDARVWLGHDGKVEED